MSTVGAKQQKLTNKHNKTGYEALPCKYMYCSVLKSDSNVIFCLQLFSKTLTCTLHLSLRESRDHCINPIVNKHWQVNHVLGVQVVSVYSYNEPTDVSNMHIIKQ